jgi:hypothetical protein
MSEQGTALRDAVRRGFTRASDSFLPTPPPARLEALCRRLAELPAKERRHELRRLSPAEGFHAARWLVQASFALRRHDPRVAVALADIAVHCARHLRLPRGHRRLAADLGAEAWANLANLRSLGGDRRAADDCWQEAERCLARGSGPPCLVADLIGMRAGHRLRQRLFQDAEDLAREAIVRYERFLGDVHLATRPHLVLAATYYYQGRLAEASASAWAAAHRFDPARDPEWAADILNDFVVLLVDVGHKKEALWILQHVRSLYRAAAGPLFFLRARWVEGRLLRRLGRPWAAMACFEEVRLGFVERGMAFDASLVALELALLYAERRKHFEVQKLAREMYPVFVAQGVPDEAAAALLVFYRSAEDLRATAQSIARVVEELEALRRATSAKEPATSLSTVATS